MIRRFAVSAIWLMACCPVLALDWPDQVEVGQLLILDAPEGVACTWEVSGEDLDGDPYDPVWREFPGALVVESRYHGLVTVGLSTDARRGLNSIRWSVVIGDDDEPGPDPDPDPDPPPVPAKLFAVIVYEEGDRDAYTVDQIDAMDSEAVRDYMDRKGFRFRSVDKDITDGDGNPPASIASFLQRAKGESLPRIIVADRDGEVLYEKVVRSEDQVLKALKHYGGE
jgi:hypothetical protein